MSATAEWFVRRGKEVRGPFNSDQLRELARSGKIRRDDRVRQGRDGAWLDAASIRGLFVTGSDGQAMVPRVAPSAGAHDPLGVDLSHAAGEAMKNCPFCGEAILKRAIKCKHCGEFLDRPQPEPEADKRKRSKPKKQTTDIFAVLCFSTGMLSLVILPIVFAPACYITGIVSYYRLKDNPELKGRWLRLVGAIAGVISILWLLVQFQLVRLPALGDLLPADNPPMPQPGDLAEDSDFAARAFSPEPNVPAPVRRSAAEWVKDLKSDDAKERQAAVDALAGMGETAAEIVVELLKDETLTTRLLAVDVLGRIGSRAETAVPALTRLLSVPEMRMAALAALGKIGPGARQAVSTIIVEFETAGADETVSEVLSRIDAGAADQFERLVLLNSQIRLLESKAQLAEAEKEAIGLTPAEFKRRAQVAIDIHKEILEQMDERTNIIVAHCEAIRSGRPLDGDLAQGPSFDGHSLAYWIDLIEKDSFTAENAIRQIGPQAVPLLAKRLPTCSESARLTILYLLGTFGPKGLPAVKSVSSLVSDLSQSRDVRLWAARALYQFGPMATDAVPSLIDGVREGDPDVRRVSCLALARIDPERPEWLDALVADVSAASNNSEVRCAAAQAIAETEAAKRAVPRLLPILRDSDPALCASLSEALDKIDPNWQSTLPPPTDEEVEDAAASVFIAAIRHRVALSAKLAVECTKLWKNTSDGKMRAVTQRMTLASINECAPDTLLEEMVSLIDPFRSLENAAPENASARAKHTAVNEALDAVEELILSVRAIYSATKPGLDQREYLIPDGAAESVKGHAKGLRKLEDAAGKALAQLATSKWDVLTIRAAREYLRRGPLAPSNKLAVSVFERTLAQLAPEHASQKSDLPMSNEAGQPDAADGRAVGEEATLLRIDFDDSSNASRFELWPDNRSVVQKGRLAVSRSTGGWIIATLKVVLPEAFRLRLKGRIDGGFYMVFPAVSRDGREFPSLNAASAKNEGQVFFKPSEFSGKALIGVVGISGAPDEAMQQIDYAPSSGKDHILELTKSAGRLTMCIDDGAAKLECATPPKIVHRRGQIRFVKYVEPSGQIELDWIEVGKFQ